MFDARPILSLASIEFRTRFQREFRTAQQEDPGSSAGSQGQQRVPERDLSQVLFLAGCDSGWLAYHLQYVK